jgi:tetratricopeptide (TPR) repeat protein
MIETRKAHELDVVELKEDLPKYGLRRGERGTVVEVFDAPEEAYMIELVDESGTSSRIADWVKSDQVINVTLLAQEAFEQGIDFFNKRKYGKAELSLKQAIELSPQFKVAVRNVVQESFGNVGDWENAILPLRLLLRIDPSDMDTRDSLAIAWLNHGVQQAQTGEISRAIICFRRSAAINPSPDIFSLLRDNLATAYRRLGIQAHQGGNPEDAQYYMSHAFMILPNERSINDLSLANAHLALAYMRQTNFKDSIRLFEAAEEAGLVSPELLNNYGAALAYEGRLDEAHRAFERALELKPMDNIIINNMSKLQQVARGGDYVTEEMSMDFPPPPPIRAYGIAA